MLENLPKKADLPKNVDSVIYKRHAESAASLLNRVGEFLTKSLGVGLDVTAKLTPYDAIFAPMAAAMSRLDANDMTNGEKGEYHSKLRKWFVASSISQRYQEGVHNKQERDANDVETWVRGGHEPAWIANAVVTPGVKLASPSGAIGRLMFCLINMNKPIDPVLGHAIGFGDGLTSAQFHHVHPTRWAPKGISDFKKGKLDTDLALNSMLLSSSTNSDWLNFDPHTQVQQNRQPIEAAFHRQLISDKAIEILNRQKKKSSDYEEFIEERYAAFARKLKDFGIAESVQSMDVVELDDPSITEDA